MWDSPSWIGSAISAKVKQESDAANRLNQYNIAKEDREARAAIQDAINANQAEIARQDRESRESIESANRSNALAVATINASGHAVPKLLPFIVGKSFIDNNNNNGNGNGSTPNQPNVPVASKATVAQKKADEAFPTLEPTFKDRVRDVVTSVGLGSNASNLGALSTASNAVLLTYLMSPVLL